MRPSLISRPTILARQARSKRAWLPSLSSPAVLLSGIALRLDVPCAAGLAAYLAHARLAPTHSWAGGSLCKSPATVLGPLCSHGDLRYSRSITFCDTAICSSCLAGWQGRDRHTGLSFPFSDTDAVPGCDGLEIPLCRWAACQILTLSQLRNRMCRSSGGIGVCLTNRDGHDMILLLKDPAAASVLGSPSPSTLHPP